MPEIERDTLDQLEVRDSIIVRGQERFTDRSELDAAPIQLLPSDPTFSEVVAAVRDLQKRDAGTQGVELQVPIERLPHD